MEFCAAEFFRLSRYRLVWLRRPMREWHSLWCLSASEGGRRSVRMDWCLPVRPFLLCLLRYVLFGARETLVHLLFVQTFCCQPGECDSYLPNASVEPGLKGEVVRDR